MGVFLLFHGLQALEKFDKWSKNCDKTQQQIDKALKVSASSAEKLRKQYEEDFRKKQKWDVELTSTQNNLNLVVEKCRDQVPRVLEVRSLALPSFRIFYALSSHTSLLTHQELQRYEETRVVEYVPLSPVWPVWVPLLC
jgi:hypothetical protein